MVSPGDPERAAAVTGRAASVSHDGEAIYGAQVVAALVAVAFVQSDIGRMLDCAVQLIPQDSVIDRVISDLRVWHAAEPDWRKTRLKIVERYGYDRYGGNCHMVRNHALIVHALLHSEGDFQKSLMIVNTCGWDTDCNSRNVGCIMGVRGGLAAIDSGNVEGHSAEGTRSPAMHYRGVAPGRPARAATFMPPETLSMSGYGIIGSPALHPGQTVEARISADSVNSGPVVARLFAAAYNAERSLTRLYADPSPSVPAGASQLPWLALR